MALTDLANVLRAAGLEVIELSGWQNRGEPYAFDPIGLLLHHDGMGLGWDGDPDNDLNVPEYMSNDGVNGSQLWVGKRGEWVILAGGYKNHAGSGSFPGIPGSGNHCLLGIETDHTDGNPWPAVQVESINRGSKALADHYGFATGLCIGHKEWAPGRKHDPENFDLDAWRAYIASAKPAPTPRPEPAPTPEEDEDDDMKLITTKDTKGREVWAFLNGDGKVEYISDPNRLSLLRKAGAKAVVVSRAEYNASRAAGTNKVT